MLLDLDYFNPSEQFAYEALHSFFIGLVDQLMLALIGRPLSTYVVFVVVIVRSDLQLTAASDIFYYSA